MEVVSPGHADRRRDEFVKRAGYAAGIAEYGIVDPGRAITHSPGGLKPAAARQNRLKPVSEARSALTTRLAWQPAD